MTELRRLEVASRVYRRVLHELNRAGSVEVGGAFVGHLVASESGGVDAHVLDFIPAGPHPEEATDVAFLADRVYQLKAKEVVAVTLCGFNGLPLAVPRA